jgi:methionyl-tRNA synthetase
MEIGEQFVFGLPAENYAIKTGIHPRTSTEANIKRFTRQMRSFGFSCDWDRVISTHQPEYYRWTQWIFLKLWEKGLANEEVKDGQYDRCGTQVTRKARNRIHEKGHRDHPLTEKQKASNRKKSMIRARIEHVFAFMTNTMKGLKRVRHDVPGGVLAQEPFRNTAREGVQGGEHPDSPGFQGHALGGRHGPALAVKRHDRAHAELHGALLHDPRGYTPAARAAR